MVAQEVVLLLAALAIAVAQTPSQPAPSPFLDDIARDLSTPHAAPGPRVLAQPPALSPAASENACPTESIEVFSDQLVNLTETACISHGVLDSSSPGPFARNLPFGFRWTDNTPKNCTIYTITIAVQAGVSCTGLPQGGNTTLNGVPTGSLYRFPYVNEYDGVCSCTPVYSPIQVFNFKPGTSYCQGCNNTFSILGSTGSNGLRPLISQASGGIYAVVIVNQWVATNFMSSPRTAFAYLLTPLNTALAVGGVSTDGNVIATADEYNHTTNSWTATVNNLQDTRYLLSAANLQAPGFADSSGSYYIVAAGGLDDLDVVQAAADIYNTTSRMWAPAPSMLYTRARFQLTSLLNGSNAVLATGGLQGVFGEQQALTTSEVYDLDTNVWQPVPDNMTYGRYRHQAVLLQDYNVVVMGGQGSQSQALASTELLSIASEQWETQANMSNARYAFTASLLANGSVLVTGGAQQPNSDANWTNSDVLASCEIYTNGTWYPTGSLNYARADHQAVVLSDGTVLVTGGGGAQAEAASEIWDPRSGTWTLAAPLLSPRVKFGLVRFGDDEAVAFGGAISGAVDLINGTSTSSLFTPAFNLSAIAPTIAPAVAPVLSPAEVAATPSVGPPDAAAPAAAPSSNTSGINIIINAGGGGISTGAVVGIVVGAIAGLLLLALAVFWCMRRQRQGLQADTPPPDIKEAGFAGFSASASPSTDSGRSTTRPRDPQSTGIISMLTSPLSLLTNKRQGRPGSAAGPPPPGLAKANSSVQMPRGVAASPFDEPLDGAQQQQHASSLDPSTGRRSGKSGRSARGVLAAVGLASPFATEQSAGQSSPAAKPNTGNSLLSDPSTGNTWDPSTQNTMSSGGGGEYDTIDLSSKLQERISNKSSGRSGRSVIISGESQKSAKSDLSRVSMAIQNELHGAEWKIERSTLTLGKRLGKGGFGEVFEATHHGSAVAIKVLEISDDRTMLDACHEFGFLHGLRHSKLVVSYGACVDGLQMMLVMELMEEDLFHAIANDNTSSADSVLWNFRGWRIAVDIASALVFLHSKGLIHLDVKSLNILLKGRRTEAKLADLGLARLVPDGHLALNNTLPGTPAYSAPEVIQAQLQWRLRTQGRKGQFRTEVGMPADIFAFGVVLFEICTGLHPARWRQDFTGEFSPHQAPPSIARLVDECLNDDPALRPTAQQVLQTLLDNRPAHLRD